MPTFDDLYRSPVGPAKPHVQSFLRAAYKDDWQRGWAAAVTDPDIRALMDRPDLTKTEKVEQLRKMRSGIEHERSKLMTAESRLTDTIAALDETMSWARGPFVLSKLDSSALHRLIEAARGGRLLNADMESSDDRNRAKREFIASLESASAFVIQHDWGAAFKGAREYAGADFRLPFKNCAFEFCVNGRRVVASAGQRDTRVAVVLFVETGRGWLMVGPFVEWEGIGWSEIAGSSRDGNNNKDLLLFICAQVMAISVALDANVAETDVIRAPDKLNAAREKSGKPPLHDYHVVCLANRRRVLPSPGASRTHRSPRLHFRRGHWRHYGNHKTWIRWTLVGNPDLGFIDKEYRL